MLSKSSKYAKTGDNLSSNLDPNETVTCKKLLLSNTIQQGAVFNILERKKLIRKKELLDARKSPRRDR